MLTLSDFTLTITLPVLWNDMDAAGHVNNLIYLKWSEEARIHYFEEMGMNLKFGGAGTGPILGHQDAKYIFPMTHPDTAIVGIRTLGIDPDRFVLQTGVFSKKYDRIAAFSHQTIIPYDYDKLAKVALPAEWVSSIERIEGRAFNS